MQSKLFTRCCRLCFDEEKQHKDITTVEELPQTLERIYNLKISRNDRISKNICVDCLKEANESLKWLTMYEELKKQVLANQERFEAEVLEQFGPPSPPPVELPPPTRTASSRSTRLSRRSAAIDEPIKQEPVATRSTRTSARAEQEDYPSEVEHSETPTTTSSSNGNEDEEEEEATSETGTTSTDAEPKCPRCEIVFADIAELEKHSCRFVCSICSTVLTYKMSLKRHLINVHKIKPQQWESYWNPAATATEEPNLLVEVAKPRKRYRYESDSPTDLEEEEEAPNSTEHHQQPPQQQQLIEHASMCRYCRKPFESDVEGDVCKLCCDVCGHNFASFNNVKRHKIQVHKMSRADVDVAMSRLSMTPSRAHSRPQSRAVSEVGSDDEPLAAFTSRDSVGGQSDGEWSRGKVYRYLCPDCDYSNVKRYRVTAHMRKTHGIPADQIDVESIQRALVEDRPGTPARSKSRLSQSRHPKSAPTTPTRNLNTPLALTQAHINQAFGSDQHSGHRHRSRARSTYQEMDRKRKRSSSACSTKSLNLARSRPTTPSDRTILVAKRRNIDSDLLAQVHQKFRPLMICIQSGRLMATTQQFCGPDPSRDSQFRVRVASHQPAEEYPTKKLFRRKAAAGLERLLVNQLRGIFQVMSNPVDTVSVGNAMTLIPSANLPPELNTESPVDSELTTESPVLDPLERSAETDTNENSEHTQVVLIQVQESEEIEETVTEYHEENVVTETTETSQEIAESDPIGGDEFVQVAPESVDVFQEESSSQPEEFITAEDDVGEAADIGSDEGLQITPD